VPQKEVHPPKEAELKKDMSSDEMVKAGQEIFEGKGLCTTCHTLGKSGALRFPDLGGIGARAATRREGHGDVAYLAESIYDPNIYIVPGFVAGMPVINKPPIGLTDPEILAVIAYLQSLGGKVTVTMESKVWPLQGGAQ
jgi:mono/diheme cytochrome c family protein